MSAPPAPQNLDAEEYVLGAIMVATPETVAAIRATGLVGDDFYFHESHGAIYSAALDLVERGEPTDVLALEHELRTSGRLEQVGGKAKLSELAALVPATANAPHHAGLVVEAARRREQVDVALALRAAAMNGSLVGDELRERIAGLLEGRRREGELRVVALDRFAEEEEPGAEAVLGTDENALIPEGATVIVYGDGGAGKTTLCLDLAFHVAAGDDWIEIAVPRPLRVLVVENEGRRPLFRKKLRRKRDAWTGSDLGDRLRVYERPWGRFSFAQRSWRQRLAATIREQEIDLAIVGPVTNSGMEAAGTLQEVRDFAALVDEVRNLSARPVVFVLVHHENARGQVSGAWEPVGETLLHVQPQGHGKLRLHVQKARASSEHHGTTLHLRWAEGEGERFTVEEKADLDDEAIGEKIAAAIAANPGTGWTKVADATPGIRRERRTAVRDELLRTGKIVNVAKNESGELVLLDHCPPRRATSLYLADDPTIRHLRPESGADGAQTAPATG